MPRPQRLVSVFTNPQQAYVSNGSIAAIQLTSVQWSACHLYYGNQTGF